MTTKSTAAKPRKPAKPTSGTKRVTKKDQLIRMLMSVAGADVATISTKLSWQTHTTRAALTGLRKAGYDVTVEKLGPGKPTHYRIRATPAAAALAEPGVITDAG